MDDAERLGRTGQWDVWKGFSNVSESGVPFVWSREEGKCVCVAGGFSRKGRGSKIVHSFLGRALSAEGYLNKERIYGDSAPGETPPKWRSRFVYRGNH